MIKDWLLRLPPATARRRADLAIRQERDRAQQYLDAAEVILLSLDVQGRITRINRKGCDLLGWTEPELLGQPWIERCLPERIRTPLTQKFDNLIGGDLTVVQNPILNRDGGECLIEWHNRVVQDEFGRVVGTLSSGTDITDREAAVRAAREAEERIRFALESADVGTWDQDYTIGQLRCSDAIEAHYGLMPGTGPRTLEDLLTHVHPDDRASLLDTIAAARKSGRDCPIRHRVIWPDGRVRWLAGSVRFVLGDGGTPIRSIGISIDVTDRRMLEEQLQQAQSVEAIGRLVGCVTHDFNNMVTAILGYSSLLLKDLSPDDHHRADVMEIDKAGTRAAGLTRQLLAFSRKSTIDPAWLDLNVVVTEMQGIIGRLVGDAVKVVLSLPPALAAVKAHRGQVEQALLNLVINAKEAMPHGGFLAIETANVELDARFTSQHFAVAPGPHVALIVTDTGAGMSREVQARLFEPFFTTKEPSKGTGLGLSTVHGIVTRCGGSVSVASEIGRGTSFTVYFPITEAKNVAPVRPGARRPRIAKQTGLVVGDMSVPACPTCQQEGRWYGPARSDDSDQYFTCTSGHMWTVTKPRKASPPTADGSQT